LRQLVCYDVPPAGDVDTGCFSDTTASCASTTSTLKSDIIEAWKRRKKKNH
jgi:hypothetical protein